MGRCVFGRGVLRCVCRWLCGIFGHSQCGTSDGGGAPGIPDRDKLIDRRYAARILFRFKPERRPPYANQVESFPNKDDQAFFEGLRRQFPGIVLRRALPNSDEQAIGGLVELARSRDCTYRQTVDALLYFSILLPPADPRIEELRKSLTAWDALEPRSIHVEHAAYQPTPPFDSPAPDGVGGPAARSSVSPISGAGVAIALVERGWVLSEVQGLFPSAEQAGSGTPDPSQKSHCMGVLSLIHTLAPSAKIMLFSSSFPVTPAPPDGSSAPRFELNVMQAIADVVTALNGAQLRCGDVVLIEEQTVNSLTGLYVPMEQKASAFEYIRTATGAGAVVVESAGNYDGTFIGPDESPVLEWRNLGDELNSIEGVVDGVDGRSLNPGVSTFRSSGAVVVSAAEGATKNGAHERLHTVNYGGRVDCYAWGSDFNPDPGIARTSAASAIVAATAALIQCAAMNQVENGGHKRLRPERVVQFLKDGGTPTYPGTPITDPLAPSAVVGTMPNLAGILSRPTEDWNWWCG